MPAGNLPLETESKKPISFYTRLIIQVSLSTHWKMRKRKKAYDAS